MRRHDDILGQLLEPCAMVSQHVQTVGIHHNRSLRAAYLGDECNGGVLLLAESGTDSHGIHVFAIYRFREILLVMVWINDSLRNADLHHVVVAAGCAHDDLSCSRAQACLRGKDGSTGHAVAAGHDECRAHIAFVGELISRKHPCPDVFLFEHHELGIHFADTFFAEADVENLQFADELLVLGEEECQFLLLEGKRHVSPDDIGTHVIGVVFGHESRRHVDTDDG